MAIEFQNLSSNFEISRKKKKNAMCEKRNGLRVNKIDNRLATEKVLYRIKANLNSADANLKLKNKN